MKEFIRRFKIVYQVYNFFHQKKLMHNEAAYKHYGLNKKYYSSVSSKDFEHLPQPKPDTVSMDALTHTAVYVQANDATKKSIEEYNENGFLILQNYIPATAIDEINNEIEAGLQDHTLHFENRNKIMFAFQKIAALKDIASEKNLIDFLNVLIQGNAVLFQSINFTSGSEQHTHSDSFHMTTYPLGGLLGVWIALEDIDEDNGPLHYYPGSHLLPYYMNKDYDNEGNSILLGNKDYNEYEDFIEKKIIEKNIRKEIFKANKGDVLIWHANLFHGGEPHLNKNKTRKSVVLHYFKEGVVCYHEITQRPALI